MKNRTVVLVLAVVIALCCLAVVANLEIGKADYSHINPSPHSATVVPPDGSGANAVVTAPTKSTPTRTPSATPGATPSQLLSAATPPTPVNTSATPAPDVTSTSAMIGLVLGDARIEISLDDGPGTTFRITGHGFAPHRQEVLSIHGVTIVLGADSEGIFTSQIHLTTAQLAQEPTQITVRDPQDGRYQAFEEDLLQLVPDLTTTLDCLLTGCATSTTSGS